MKVFKYFLLILFTSCIQESNTLSVEQIQVAVEYASTHFPEYCSRQDDNDEHNSILTSFVGDHQSSYIYASRRRYEPSIQNEEIDFQFTFNDYKPTDAISEIIINATDYHFTMINEAHYCGEHRVFTTSLLKPLWEKGYRYLALEALSYFDTLMNNRTYAIDRTGYYIQESAFGNMIREARSLGYQLIPYETQFMGQSSTHRDSVQAVNLISQTLNRDTVGKVLVHVGYGHLFEEFGSTYKPLGWWVKNNTGLDILTIDQVRMTDASLPTKIHPYYSHAYQSYPINTPVVFKHNTNGYLVDPVQQGGIDLQVYHPRVAFINGRPNWLQKEDVNNYPLPEDFLPFEGYHLFVLKKGEPIDAIPVDQFIISMEKNLLLPEGEFDSYVVDCTNKVLAQFQMRAN